MHTGHVGDALQLFSDELFEGNRLPIWCLDASEVEEIADDLLGETDLGA